MALIPAAAAIGSAVTSSLSRRKSATRPRRPRARRTVVATVRVPGPARRNGRAPTRKLRTRTRKGIKKQVAIDMAHPVPVTVPANGSTVNGGTTFAVSALKGPFADYDRRDAMTANGSLELAVGVKTGSDYAEDAKNGGLSVTTALAAYLVRPGSLASNTGKLYSLATIFSHYRLRKMNIRYVPASSSTSTAQVYFAWTSDPDATSYASTTVGVSPTTMREFACSFVTPAWQSASTQMVFEGSHCWSNDSGDLVDEKNQGIFFCIVRGGAASTTYGRIEIDYEIDLFGVRPYEVQAAPNHHNGFFGDHSLAEGKVDEKSHSSEKNKLTSYASVSNDDVKSLFEEKLTDSNYIPFGGMVERPSLKRSEPVPIPRPAIISKTQDDTEKKRK